MTTNFRTRVISGSFWSLVGFIVFRGSGFITSIIVIRILGKESYGELAMYQATVDLFGALVGLGLGTTATKLIAEHRAHDPARTGRILTLLMIISGAVGIVGGAIVIGIAGWFATYVLDRPSLSTMLVWGGFGLFFSIMSGVQSGALAGLEAFKPLARLSIVLGILLPAMTVPLVLLQGQLGVVIAGFSSGIVSVLFCWRELRVECNKYGIKQKYESLIWPELSEMIKFAFPVFIANLTVIPITWLCSKILTAQPLGYSELGRLNAAQQFRAVFTAIQNAFGPVMFPIMAESHTNEVNFFRSTQFSAKITLLLGVPVTVLLIVFSDYLAIVYGSDFADISMLICIMAVVSLVNLYNASIGIAFVASGRTWSGMLMNLAWGAITIAGAFALVPTMGALGLAVAYLIGYLAHTLIQLAYLEWVVAPGSIAGQFRLISFSVCALAFAITLVLTSNLTLVFQVAVILFSTLPLWFALIRANKATHLS